jgi:hypothetical protein
MGIKGAGTVMIVVAHEMGLGIGCVSKLDNTLKSADIRGEGNPEGTRFTAMVGEIKFPAEFIYRKPICERRR